MALHAENQDSLYDTAFTPALLLCTQLTIFGRALPLRAQSAQALHFPQQSRMALHAENQDSLYDTMHWHYNKTIRLPAF